MSFLKKLRNKSKSSDEQAGNRNIPADTVSSGRDLKEYTAPISGKQDEPERDPVTLSGSLFSGMKLTEAATKNEDDSSPYLMKREQVENVENSSKSGFSFINSSVSVLPAIDAGNESDGSQVGFSSIDSELTGDSQVEEALQLNKPSQNEPEYQFDFIASKLRQPEVSSMDNTQFLMDYTGHSTTDNTDQSMMDGQSVMDYTGLNLTGQSTMDHTTMDYTGQSTIDHTGQSTIDHTGQSTMDHTTMDYTGQSTIDHTGQSTMDHTTMDHTGQSTIDHTGQSTMDHTDQPIIDNTSQSPTLQLTVSQIKPEQKASRQIPSFGKRKKLKALRPGQERNDEIYASLHERADSEENCHNATELSSDQDLLLNSNCEDKGECNSMAVNIKNSSDIITNEEESLITVDRGIDNCNNNGESLPHKNVSNNVDRSDNMELLVSVESNIEESSQEASHQQVTVSKDLVNIVIEPNVTSSNSNYFVELSGNDKLIAVLEVLESNINGIRLELNDLQKQYGSVIEEILLVLKSRIIKRQHIADLKVKEATALAEENYELAEKLNQELESVQMKEDFTLADKAHSTITEWIRKCQAVVCSEITIQVEYDEELHRLIDEQSDVLASHEKEFSLQQAKKKLQLQTMKDEIEKEEGHIALDREHVDKREQHLQDEISQRAAEFVTCRKALEENEREVDEEIKTLQEKLVQMQEKKKELALLIAEENMKIDEVHKELSSLQEQLDEEKASIKDKEGDLQSKIDVLNEFEMSYNTAEKGYLNTKECLLTVINSCQRKVVDMSNRKDDLQKSQSECENWKISGITEILKPSEELYSLLDTEISKEKELKAVTSKVLVLQADLSNRHKLISDIGGQLPKLQESKKIAVAARQYREAARLSNEEKELQNQLEKHKDVVNNLEEELGLENNSVSQLNNEFSRIKEERMTKEKEEDIKRIHQLVVLLNAQQTNLSRLTGGTTIPTHSALNQWCKFHELLIHDYCAKHGLNVDDFLTEDISSIDALTNEVLTKENEIVTNEQPVKDELHAKQLQEKISDLEAKIANACTKEMFDLAAELDDELQVLKSQI